GGDEPPDDDGQQLPSGAPRRLRGGSAAGSALSAIDLVDAHPFHRPCAGGVPGASGTGATRFAHQCCSPTEGAAFSPCPDGYRDAAGEQCTTGGAPPVGGPSTTGSRRWVREGCSPRGGGRSQSGSRSATSEPGRLAPPTAITMYCLPSCA